MTKIRVDENISFFIYIIIYCSRKSRSDFRAVEDLKFNTMGIIIHGGIKVEIVVGAGACGQLLHHAVCSIDRSRNPQRTNRTITSSKHLLFSWWSKIDCIGSRFSFPPSLQKLRAASSEKGFDRPTELAGRLNSLGVG